MTRLGEGEPIKGAKGKGSRQRILRQFRRVEEPDVLCLGEIDPFRGKGHLPTPGAETNG